MKLLIIHIIVTLVVGYLVFVHEAVNVPGTAFNASMICLAIYILLWLSSFFYQRSYFHKIPKAFVLFVYFCKEFVVANIRIAHDIISPRYQMQPTIVALPLDVHSDFEITVLACIITLTPGTLSLDLSPDRKTLYIHALYIPKQGLDKLKHDIKNGFEKRIIELVA
jgi:multicomponent Na+:H+ antiporter subunit E